ncbi:hypothetical protein NVP1123O_30 [Vibrio phage 1.123.O._10N.286.48.F3]|nr:hypothetical protein NVP1123O_30 [Vibrio phage 1.123.O._10N.286.48.F3]
MALVFENPVLQKLFGSEYAKFSTIPIDLTIEERVSHSMTITNKPAEDGTVFSDNIIEQPTVISFDGICTSDFLGDTWQDKKAKLDELRRIREPFTFVGILGTYESVFFSNIEYTANSRYANSLKFTATLQQIPIIKASTVTVPADASKNPEQQAPPKNKGKVQPKQAPEQSSQSILSSITGIGA